VSSTTALRGFRVPTVVISPRARRGVVAHGTYDHTSILRAIEWRWGLPPLTPRDANANNLMEVLDFDAPSNPVAPAITMPPFVAGLPCPVQEAGVESAEWSDLKKLALDLGWRLPL
jgi:phospholipase C